MNMHTLASCPQTRIDGDCSHTFCSIRIFIHVFCTCHPYQMLLCNVMWVNNPESRVHNSLVAEKVGSRINPRTADK